VVYGPPGSGKTTYVGNNKRYGDLIYDFDELFYALAGALDIRNVLPKFVRPRFVPFVIYLREALYKRLKLPNDIECAWIITTRMTESIRANFIRDFEDPEFVVLETPKQECIRRMADRGSDELNEKVVTWWKRYKAHEGDRVVRWG